MDEVLSLFEYSTQLNKLAKEYVNKNEDVAKYNKAATAIALRYIHKKDLPIATLFDLGFLAGQEWSIVQVAKRFENE